MKITIFNYRKICTGSDKLKHLSETFTATIVLNFQRVVSVHSVSLNVLRERDKERLIITLIHDFTRYDTASKHIAIRSGETREQPSDLLL